MSFRICHLLALLTAAVSWQPARAQVAIEVSRSEGLAGSWIEVPVSFTHDGQAVAFNFDIEIRDQRFADVFVDNCVADYDASIRACNYDDGALRYVAANTTLQPLPSGPLGSFELLVPPDAQNGRYFLPIDPDSVDVSTADGSPHPGPVQLPAGWVDVSGGVTTLRYVGGDGYRSAGRFIRGEEVELPLERRSIAVRSTEVSAQEICGALGLPQSTPSETIAPGWNWIQLPPSHELAALSDIARVRDRLDEHLGAGSTFVSPVFRHGPDRYDILIPTRHMLAIFEDVATEEDAHAVYERIWLDGIEAEPYYPNIHPRAYRLLTSARDGLEVVAIANALWLAPETRLATADFIGFGRGGTVASPLFQSSFE